MKIGTFDATNAVLVIAEIGNNHEGSYSLAEEMVGKAIDAGADAVKFQTIKTEHLVSTENPERFAKLKGFELTYNEFERLAGYTHQASSLFISTPFDLESAQFLGTIVDGIKIASGDNTFYPLIEEAARTAKPLLISTGLADMKQISKAKDLVYKTWQENKIDQDLALLHCVSAYPTPPNEANLLTIPYLSERLDCTIGYSDHTLGIDAAVAAVAMGARVIEKHFTLDNNYSDFRDHQLSANPETLKAMVGKIRDMEIMLGTSEALLQDSEKEGVTAYRRSIVAAHNLAAGTTLNITDITWVRPGDGLSPGNEAMILGRQLKQDVSQGYQLNTEDLF